MPKRSRNSLHRFTAPEQYFRMERSTQISESHCAPAVTQMLLSNLGVQVSQEAVAEAGGATSLIEMHGMRLDQIITAVKTLVPEVQFWYKEHASLKELVALVKDYQYPVAVEWQGIFVGLDEQEKPEDESDYGHYSLITYVDPEKRELIIVDPYKDFASQDRILGFNTFANRWWDINEVTDPKTGREKYVEDHHLMFLITPPQETFPETLGMKRA
jgi:hypothetical protein